MNCDVFLWYKFVKFMYTIFCQEEQIAILNLPVLLYRLSLHSLKNGVELMGTQVLDTFRPYNGLNVLISAKICQK